ncbi:MAG: MBOAT family protein, partial [Chitinophagaceae bacterium]|nr:MBOAT family protein [Chitinophagaceae bacterium]
FVDYAVFVSFFPLLVAGPIERANHLLPQVQRKRLFNYSQAVEGCRLILWGMFKKVVIADSLAATVDQIYQNYPNESGISLLLGAIAFSFQIYGDFSGYSDIALGTAKLFGFELLSNFKFPYFSRDVAEFWRRWHISLSSWFRDYLYIPLGGSKFGKLKAIRNTFIIFIVSGFWHGASWNFIVWGFLHACAFLPLLLLNKNRQYVTHVVAENNAWPSLKEVLQMLGTFLFVTLAWIFFRAETLHQAIGYITRFAVDAFNHPMDLIQMGGGKQIMALIVPLLLGDWYLRHDERSLKTPRSGVIRILLYTAITLAVAYCLLSDYLNDKGQEFIYFQF